MGRTIIIDDITPYEIAKYIAAQDSKYHSNVLHQLACILKTWQKPDSDGMQMLWIKDVITQDAKEMIAKAYRYICCEDE